MAGYKNDEELKNGKQAEQTAQPGTQGGQWKDQLDDTIDKILNREQFSYDMDSDAMYEQMKDQYIRQGQMAMMDTMGKAATMTGGYGNSYAQGVGQQAYQEYLQGFNDVVPDLYQMALDAYTREGQALGDKYAVLADKRGDELEAAELAASLGDYSLLAKYYGWTDDYMDGLVNPKEESGYTGYVPTGPQDGPEDGPLVEPQDEPTLSEAGTNFMSTLPYLRAGGSVKGWKDYVTKKLENAYNSGQLSESDTMLIMQQLGLVG